jgi:hypothetical protein
VTTQGLPGTRGQVAVSSKRHGLYVLWSVCLGGRTWTEPDKAMLRSRILRKAARRLVATPNRQVRRAMAATMRKVEGEDC